MQITIDEIISLWRQDKKKYDLFTNQVEFKLNKGLQEQGLDARILARTKDEKSLVKKLYKKRNLYYYHSMTDKSAARVICKFKQDVILVEKLIDEVFKVENKENKIHNLDFKEQGYKSIHFDVKLKADNTEEAIYAELKDLIAEIQVRTNCEDTWAEIYHNIGYKATSDLNPEIKREFYCLAGLLEVADNCFSNLYKNIAEMDVLNEDYVLNYLKKIFVQKISTDYDYDFSYENIKLLLSPSQFDSTTDFSEKMSKFLTNYDSKINLILKDMESFSTQIPYLTQPEIFLIFYLIEFNPHILKETWEQGNLHSEDLYNLFTSWGVSLSDFDLDY